MREHLNVPGTRLRWWSALPDEDMYMEITSRDDIGGDLIAPIGDRTGGATGSYSLVRYVQPGNVIAHYDSDSEAIVGASIALGEPEPRAQLWRPRGMSARRDRVQAEWRSSLAVPLGGYRTLQPAVTRDEIRRRQAEVFAVQASLQASGMTGSLFFPWIDNRGRLDTAQSYLVKMPRRASALFPDLDAAAEDLRTAYRRSAGTPLPELDEIAELVEKQAGRTPKSSRRRSLGQGFATDQAAKVAIEALAMNAAADYFAREWDVEDVHSGESFDLRCTRGTEELHVEVKGTTTAGEAVLLTPNEVAHARSYRPAALFVLADVRLSRAPDGSVEAMGGSPMLLYPWSIDSGSLHPVGYRYELPQGQASDGS